MITIIKKQFAISLLLVLAACSGSDSNHINEPLLGAASPETDTPELRQLSADSHRLLQQATFGPTSTDITRVNTLGPEAWIDEQMSLQATLLLPQYKKINDPRWGEYANIWWRTAITSRDQLRQRVAFALSEIFVISARDGLGDEQPGVANYYDLLLNHAFGNYRDLLEAVTLSPIMGEYLSMKGNHKADAEQQIQPDENYARELLQLFSIGLTQLNQDGTAKLDADGVPLPTYDQDTIEGFAHVFTGWHFKNADHFLWPKNSDYISPMVPYEEYHDMGPKRLLRGYEIAPGNSARDDLKIALDNIFYHPNVGPFISRLLIQRLVTSNPTPSYIQDIAAAFNSNADGVRGDLGHVIKQILLHDEARNGHKTLPSTFGKLKEPVIRITSLWRAFRPGRISEDFNYAYSHQDIGQGALNSPSVFNFFTPGFSQPGMIRNSGLVSPEFQIHDESSIIKLTSRLLSNSIWSHNFKYESDQHRIVLDISDEVSLEQKSHLILLDHLDLLLLGGTMSDALKQEVLNLMQAYDHTGGESQRVVEAIFLIISSPEAAVQI